MSERLSIRAYSRHRGVSDTAVRKAIQSGRITLGDDGRIDPQLADAQWRHEIIEHNWNHFYNGGFEQILWQELQDMLNEFEFSC